MKKVFFALLLSVAPFPVQAQTGAGDIETTAQQVLMESAKQNNEDLRGQMQDVQRTNRNKAAMREHMSAIRRQAGGLNGQNTALPGKTGTQGILIGMRPVDHGPAPHGQASLGAVQKQADTLRDQKDSHGELGQDPGLHIQESMDRRQRAQRALSDMQKKQGDTQSGVIQNMK